jgi:hypothetical protein
VRYFDENRVPVREISFDEVRLVGGRPIPPRMTVQPLDKPDQRTVLATINSLLQGKAPRAVSWEAAKPNLADAIKLDYAGQKFIFFHHPDRHHRSGQHPVDVAHGTDSRVRGHASHRRGPGPAAMAYSDRGADPDGDLHCNVVIAGTELWHRFANDLMIVAQYLFNGTGAAAPKGLTAEPRSEFGSAADGGGIFLTFFF